MWFFFINDLLPSLFSFASSSSSMPFFLRFVFGIKWLERPAPNRQRKHQQQKTCIQPNFFPEYLVLLLSCHTVNSSILLTERNFFLFVSLFAPKNSNKQRKNARTEKVRSKNFVCVCVPRSRERSHRNSGKQEKIWSEFKFPSHNSIKHSENSIEMNVEKRRLEFTTAAAAWHT